MEVQVESAPELPAVYADRGKLKRAILNLLVNSRQAMPGGGKIEIRVGTDRGKVVVEIADTGCGINSEDRSRVFDTFFSTKSEGSGLGLAIVRQTIEEMGGTIRFESDPGLGTTFQINLPSSVRFKATLTRSKRLYPNAG